MALLRPSGLQRQHVFFVFLRWIQAPFVSLSRAVWSYILICISLYSAFNQARYFSELASPIAYSVNYVEGLYLSSVSWFQGRGALLQEITELKRRIRDLECQQNYHHLLHLENKHLKKLFEVQSATPWVGKRTEVLMVPFDQCASVMWVAATNSMHDRQSVVTEDGFIGRIEGINRHTARVRLLTDALSRLPVYVENSRKEVIIAGQNNRELIIIHQKEAELGEESTPLNVGTKLVTAGYHDLPAGIPVAVVSKVEGHKIYAQPIASTKGVHYVQLLEKESEE